jgi:hypothetical protein
MNRSTLRVIIPILSLIFIITGTYIAIKIAKGYRPTKQGTITGTGLLAANSFPPGAEVYLNEKLTTATDDTINLEPSGYDITIKKEGYIPWQKKLTVKKELVTQTNATLFRSVPGLTPLTLSGATNVNPSPDGQKIAYAVSDAINPAKNGLYVLDLTNGMPFASPKEPKLIAKNYNALNFSNATLLWSPGSTQILAHFGASPRTVSNYLLSSDNTNDLSTLPDVSIRLPIILAQWEEDLATKETKEFILLPPELKKVATESATNVYLSPNEKKVMYTSTGYVTLPEALIKTPLATSTQPEERSLKPGNIYIYDLIEDKNFLMGSTAIDAETPQKQILLTNTYQQTSPSDAKDASTPGTLVQLPYNRLQDPKDFNQTALNFKTHYSPLYVGTSQWYPDSSHLIITDSNKIDIIEYDAQNRITVYSGPFENSITYPWPDGSKLIISTNFNPSSDQVFNLYAVDIR